MKSNILALFGSVLFATQIAFCVPTNIKNAYDDICWTCYTPEIPIQNFLVKYRETLRNLCFKKDAQACQMMGTLYAALQNDIDAQDYWQRACKLGIKETCAKVDTDEEQ